MFKTDDLKEKIEISEEFVSCPVKDCNVKVDRKRRKGNEGKNFICTKHNIHITPSTFIYNSENDNLLWNTKSDKDLLVEISKCKRESRMSSENSEDALSWNVFRYLENNKLLAYLLGEISNENHNIIDVIYWSYSKKEKESWSHLIKASDEFGEIKNRGSEPDIIVQTDKTLFFIEAKFFSSNRTSGYKDTLTKRINNPKKYTVGSQHLFENIFKNKYKSVVKDQKYELMRLWLLGEWIAKELNLNFQLINLVLDKREVKIESDFGKHIISNSNRIFKRYTWESIYYFIKNKNLNDLNTKIIFDYFESKAGGYNGKGEIRKAFNL